MADDTAKVLKTRLDRAAKLLETLRELQAKTFEVTEELKKVIAGEDALGDVLKRVEAAFAAEYHQRYSRHYGWQYAKDRPQWKRLLKLAGEEDVRARIVAYFHEPDPYTQNARHPFGLFVSRFNQLVPHVEDPGELTLDAPTVADCRHVPPCRTDQDHTKRKLDDLRAGAR